MHGCAGHMYDYITCINVTVILQRILNIVNGLVGADVFVVIQSAHSPHKIQGIENRFVIRKNKNTCLGRWLEILNAV